MKSLCARNVTRVSLTLQNFRLCLELWCDNYFLFFSIPFCYLNICFNIYMERCGGTLLLYMHFKDKYTNTMFDRRCTSNTHSFALYTLTHICPWVIGSRDSLTVHCRQSVHASVNLQILCTRTHTHRILDVSKHSLICREAQWLLIGSCWCSWRGERLSLSIKEWQSILSPTLTLDKSRILMRANLKSAERKVTLQTDRLV